MKLTKLDKEVVKDTTYIKLVENRTHFGPVSEEKIARAKAAALSAAANKVRLMSNFTVKVEIPQAGSKNDRTQARSLLFLEVGNSPAEVAGSAVYLMQAWDNKYGEQGTPDYVNKLTKALQARANAYTELGINPNSQEKPNLTSDQRVVYNSIVGPTGFDYYEYHLAFKLEGQTKFARSKTYRSLRPLDLRSMLNTLSTEVKALRSRVIVSTRQTN